MISSRRARVILAALILLCALFVYNYATRLMELSEAQAQVVAMQAQAEEARARQMRLEAELAALDDPGFLDRVAREEFDMAKPGDKVVVVLRETPTPLDTAVQDATLQSATIPGQPQPVWRQWVNFFAADFSITLQ